MEKEECAHMGLLDVWVFGWPRTSKTGLSLVTPGRRENAPNCSSLGWETLGYTLYSDSQSSPWD